MPNPFVTVFLKRKDLTPAVLQDFGGELRSLIQGGFGCGTVARRNPPQRDAAMASVATPTNNNPEEEDERSDDPTADNSESQPSGRGVRVVESRVGPTPVTN
jgi:hypothetical protein